MIGVSFVVEFAKIACLKIKVFLMRFESVLSEFSTGGRKVFH